MFSKNGGNMAENGAVGWMFHRKEISTSQKRPPTKIRCWESCLKLERRICATMAPRGK